MRHSDKKILRILYILLLSALLTVPALAAESFTTGSAGVALIQKYEGFSESRFLDVDGSWRIGYGTDYTTAEKRYPDNEKDAGGYILITKEQAETLMRELLTAYEKTVNSYLSKNGITVNQNQFDALVSFTYNIGVRWTTGQNADGTPYKIRTLLEGDPKDWTEEKVQEAFGTWVGDGSGNTLEGLVLRRRAEADLFMTPYDPDAAGGEAEIVYTDVDKDLWYAPFVQEAYDRAIMQGRGDGIFAPEDDMTRAEMVQALANFAGADLSQYTASEFSDVPADAWYAPAVAWAAASGIVNGMGDGTFHPGDPIRREHICNIVSRYLEGLGVSPGEAVEPFLDDGEIEATSIESVYYCASLELVNGMGDGTFAPKRQATRAQIAKILVCTARLLEGTYGE